MIEYRIVHNNVERRRSWDAKYILGEWESLRQRNDIEGELRHEEVTDGEVTWQHTINVRQGWKVRGPSGRLEDC